jgi:hypothetical protein
MLLLVSPAYSDAETSELKPKVRDNVQIPSETTDETGCVMIETDGPAGKLYKFRALPSWSGVVWGMECTSLRRVTFVGRRERPSFKECMALALSSKIDP